MKEDDEKIMQKEKGGGGFGRTQKVGKTSTE